MRKARLGRQTMEGIMDLGLMTALLALVAAPGDYGAGSSMVGFLDAATLSAACAADVQAVDARAICLGYIAGAADQLLADQAMRGPTTRTICIPPDVTTSTVVATVGAYAAWSRNAKGVSAAGFVEAALERAYPCQSEAEPM